MSVPLPLIDTLLDAGLAIVDRVWPDPTKQAEERRKLIKLHQDGKLAELQAEVGLLQGQLRINEKEAEHKSVFVAGWRPFVGWVCGFALAYVTVIEPVARFVATMLGYDGKFPVIDTTITMQVLIGMLGLGVMRTREKEKNVHSDSMKKPQ